MRNNRSIRLIILIWLAWIVIIFLYQALVTNRLELVRPDKAMDWVYEETSSRPKPDRIYLTSPFLNTHISWDSEYYLSIALGGYQDPAMRVLQFPGQNGISLNYAFFPIYPLTIRLLAIPLSVFSLTPIATATLAGLIISLLGTLAGMISLYYLTRDWLGEEAGIRTAFYLLIFPTGFFLAQVYTEGLFIGITFCSLVMMRRKQWIWAAILASLATWTRAVGVLLFIPFFINFLKVYWQGKFSNLLKPAAILISLLCLTPVISYLAWHNSSLYYPFRVVEAAYFQRGYLLMGQSLGVWETAIFHIIHFNGQTSTYYLIETSMVALGLASSMALLRKHADIALFSLAVIFISLTSGQAQSMSRYVLTCPSVFFALGYLGKKEPFDRAWTIASILAMGMLAALFSFDLWVG